MSESKKFPKSPKSTPVFKKYWGIFIEEILERDNFKPGYLSQLELLCDMYVEYENLTAIIDMLGYTYEAIGGRYGNQIKIRPEVNQLNRCRAEIRGYSAMLGLRLAKDSLPSSPEEEKEEW